jgi:isopenicillin N synthase-like dioxygenase
VTATPASVPLIDISALRDHSDPSAAAAVAAAIDAACRDTGFFCISGHAVDPESFESLDALAREFFALPQSAKAEIAMARGGRAWRVGDEPGAHSHGGFHKGYLQVVA